MPPEKQNSPEGNKQSVDALPNGNLENLSKEQQKAIINIVWDKIVVEDWLKKGKSVSLLSMREGDISHVRVSDPKTGKKIGQIDYDNDRMKVIEYSSNLDKMERILENEDTQERIKKEQGQEKDAAENKIDAALLKIQEADLLKSLVEGNHFGKLLNWQNSSRTTDEDIKNCKLAIVKSLNLKDGDKALAPNDIIIRTGFGRVNLQQGIRIDVSPRKKGPDGASFIIKVVEEKWVVSDLELFKAKK